MKLSAINRRIYPSKNILLSEEVAFIDSLVGRGKGRHAETIFAAAWQFWIERMEISPDRAAKIEASMKKIRLNPGKVRMTDITKIRERMEKDRLPDLADLIAIVYFKADPSLPTVWEQGQRKAIFILETFFPDVLPDDLLIPTDLLGVDTKKVADFVQRSKASGRTDLLTGYIDPRRRKIDPIGFAGFQQRGGRVVDTFIQIIEVVDILLTLINKALKGESLSDFSEFFKWKAEGKSFDLYGLDDARQQFKDTYEKLSSEGRVKPTEPTEVAPEEATPETPTETPATQAAPEVPKPAPEVPKPTTTQAPEAGTVPIPQTQPVSKPAETPKTPETPPVQVEPEDEDEEIDIATSIKRLADEQAKNPVDAQRKKKEAEEKAKKEAEEKAKKEAEEKAKKPPPDKPK